MPSTLILEAMSIPSAATLYELLSGVAPFNQEELKKKSSAEIFRVIQEHVPVQPSAAVSTNKAAVATDIATARRATPQQLKSTISGDLDWIVMRAMDKDRERRYESASALAEDIRRYLNQQPIVARPPSVNYRLRKFLLRNRVAVLLSAIILSSLFLATVVSSYFAVWALQSRDQAEFQTQLALDENAALKSYQGFLDEGVFAQANPLEEPDRNVTLRLVLDRAAQRLNQEQLRPDVEAAVRTTLGKTYRGLGEYQQSLTHLRRAHTLYVNSLHSKTDEFRRTTQLQTCQVANELATTLLALAEHAEAKSYLDQSMVTARELGDAELQIQTTRLLAAYFASSGDPQMAESLLKEVFEDRKQNLGEQHFSTHGAAADLAYAYQLGRRREQALTLLEPSYQALAKQDPFHPTTLKAAVRLARLYVLEGNLDQAQQIYATVDERSRPHVRRKPPANNDGQTRSGFGAFFIAAATRSN